MEGGTERVVHYLTESLVQEGHDVTLFASGDSSTSATLAPCCPEASSVDFTLRRYPDDVGINVDRRVGPMEIVVIT
jgi:hypothetical protein